MRAGFESLHRFLTAPESLLDDPTFCALRKRIADARAAHRPIKAAQQALSDYVHAALRPLCKDCPSLTCAKNEACLHLNRSPACGEQLPKAGGGSK